MNKKSFDPRQITILAMFTALSFVLVLVSEAIPKVEGFLSYEPKDAVIVIAGLLFGPASAVIISVLVAFIEMVTISSTGPIGFLMNIISTCAFVLPASVLYKKKRTKAGAVIGLSLGVVAMTVMMLLWNYIITPLYMHVERDVVIKMLVPVFLPFNLIKGGINAALTMLLYKPTVTALRSANLAAPSPAGSEKSGFSIGFFLLTLVILATFVLAFLALSKVI